MKVGTDSVLLGCLVKQAAVTAILDVGTGTGLLALMMAQRFSSAIIDAVEIDSEAFDEASYNIRESSWSGRMSIYHSSFQEYIKTCGKKYNLIISNPPYYKGSDNIKIEDIQRSRARHDNELPFEALLKGCCELLVENGSCWFVLPKQEGESLISISQQFGLFLHHKISVQPKPSKEVNRLVLGFSNVPQTAIEQSITIYGEDGSHTLEYYELTKLFLLWEQHP
jgi:tRNA1Val (adenine37-N6)-methyltransferase